MKFCATCCARARGKCVNLAFRVGFFGRQIIPPPLYPLWAASPLTYTVYVDVWFFFFLLLLFSRFFIDDTRVSLRPKGFFFLPPSSSPQIASSRLSGQVPWTRKEKVEKYRSTTPGVLVVDFYRISVRTVGAI